MNMYLELPLMEFVSSATLRTWLEENHTLSKGIWVRLYKTNTDQPSVTFEELLDQGLCFGWSESLRHKGDDVSYYQKFTPRRTVGTSSKRNLDHTKKLIAAGEMTPAGLKALGLK